MVVNGVKGFRVIRCMAANGVTDYIKVLAY